MYVGRSLRQGRTQRETAKGEELRPGRGRTSYRNGKGIPWMFQSVRIEGAGGTKRGGRVAEPGWGKKGKDGKKKKKKGLWALGTHNKRQYREQSKGWTVVVSL